MGIVEVDDAEIMRGLYGDDRGTIRAGSFSQIAYFHGEGLEWTRTLESAMQVAEQMRMKKIETHKRAIARLEKLKVKHIKAQS